MALKPKARDTSGSNQEHALLSPSAAKKWLQCPAALVCEKDIPNTSGQAAVLGTAMHTLAEVHLNQYMRGEALPLSREVGAYVLNDGKGPIRAATKPPKDGVLVTEDMISQVTKYTDYAKAIIDTADFVKLEMRAELTQLLHPDFVVHDPKTGTVYIQTFGTADLVAVVPRSDGTYMLIVGDLKTGRHRVEAKENKQLMLYAIAILRRLRRRFDISLVRLVIFQPYAGGESYDDMTPEALDIFAKHASKRAVIALDAYHAGKKALKPKDFRPSADACQWCRFAEKCNAKAKAAVNQLASDADLADETVARETGDPEMTMAELKAAWDKLPELRQHIATIEKAVAAALHRGDKVPGLKLVEGKPGNRAWDDVEAVTDLLRTNAEEKAMYKETLLSPTEAEKTISKLFPKLWAELEQHITRKPGSPTVANSDDDRPEWKAASDADLN